MPSLARDAIEAVNGELRVAFELIAGAGCSPAAVREMAWTQAMLPSALGGASVGYSSEMCAAAYAASVLATWTTLRRTCPALHGVDVADTGPSQLRLVTEFRQAYDELRAKRDG